MFRLGHVRVLAGVLLVGAAVSIWQVGAPPAVAAAQTDLRFTSKSAWTADPAARRVHVQVVVTATSHTVDSGGRRFYYDQVQLTVPPFSGGFGATSAAGQKAPVTIVSSTPSGVIVNVGLGQRLYSGQTGSVTLKFDLIDSGGSTDRDFRISDNVVSFPVWAFGSPNTSGSSVSVSFPTGFTVQQEFGSLTQAASTPGGKIAYSADAIPDSTEVSAWFTAVKPVAATDFRTRTLAIGPLNVDLEYWAGDTGWADQVEHVLESGYPVLRDLIGLGDPANTTFTVEEASTQEIGGYSGSYDSETGRVTVSYFADPFVILHEAAHMWFNSNLVSDRWVQEGFASYYAQQVVDRLGYPDHAPGLTDRMRQSAVPLNDWVTASQPNLPVNGYLYGASLSVAQQVAAEAGNSGLAIVWRAIVSDAAPYQPAHGAVESGTGANDWRVLLDLLEQRTHDSYSAIWRDWVVDPSQAPLLQQRDSALAAVADARKAAGSWDLPQEIRRSLDTWQFNQAIAFTSQAQAVLAQRDQIADRAKQEQTTPPSTLRTAFEASSLGVAADEATGELSALFTLAAARQAQADAGGAAGFGLLGGTDPSADLNAARRAFAAGDLNRAASLADSARTAWQNASGAARVRILGTLLVLGGGLLLVMVILWVRRYGNLGSETKAEMGPPDSTTAAAEAGAGAELTPAVAPSDVGLAAGPPVPGDSAPGSEESAYDLLQRGHLLLQERHNAQAAVVLERAARIEEKKSSILEALGRAYFNSGQHARAAETFEALLEVDPSADYGHFGLGLSFARLGRVAEARTHLRLAAAMDPASEIYRRALEKVDTAKR